MTRPICISVIVGRHQMQEMKTVSGELKFVSHAHPFFYSILTVDNCIREKLIKFATILRSLLTIYCIFRCIGRTSV